jgi:hypothetical protein
MAVGIHTEENEGVRLHVDRGVLRDIIEARIATDKRRSYYTIGSVFSAMGFTLVALGSKNYTASSLFVLIGIFYYLCISGVSVNYVDDEWAGEDEDGESVEMKEMGRAEKVELVRVLMQELGGFHLSTEDIEHLVQPVYTVKGEEGQEEEDSLEGVDNLEPVLEVEGEDGEDGLDGDAGEVLPEPPRLARAETSYSEGVVVDEGVVVEQVQAQAPIEEAVEPVVEVQEAKNNVEDESGSATPEASGSAD